MIDWNCFWAAMRERFPFLWINALLMLLFAVAVAATVCLPLIIDPPAFILCAIPMFLLTAGAAFVVWAFMLVVEAATALQGCIVPVAAGVAGAAPGVAAGALTPTDCAAAQADLASARAALAAAETALRDQEQRVRDAKDRLRNAKAAAIAATAAVVALLVNPFGWGGLIAAIAAQIAASALVLVRSRQLGQELGTLSQRALDHAAAQARLAAAEALVAALCGSLPATAFRRGICPMVRSR